ncbi:MAG: ribosome maturation factor RimP [Clostridia bacterium]
MSKICEIAERAILPTLTEMDVEIVETEFVNGRKDEMPTLWIYIYHKDGVDLDLLEKVHHAIDPLLDDADPTEGKPYTLNVSSPGLDRPFKTQADFDRHMGEEVEIKLYTNLDGKKSFEGVMTYADDNVVKVQINEEEKIFERKQIAKISMAIKF